MKPSLPNIDVERVGLYFRVTIKDVGGPFLFPYMPSATLWNNDGCSSRFHQVLSTAPPVLFPSKFTPAMTAMVEIGHDNDWTVLTSDSKSRSNLALQKGEREASAVFDSKGFELRCKIGKGEDGKKTFLLSAFVYDASEFPKEALRQNIKTYITKWNAAQRLINESKAIKRSYEYAFEDVKRAEEQLERAKRIRADTIETATAQIAAISQAITNYRLKQ